jgi:hypothetical protein
MPRSARLILSVVTWALLFASPAPARAQAATPATEALPTGDPVMLRKAIGQAELPDPAAALATLDSLIDPEAKPDIVQLTARLLRHQLTGDFKARQQDWLNRRVLDMVVLVPDEAAFIAAVAGWTDQQFYPVLLADAWYAPIFVRAFAPRQVVVWEGEGAAPYDLAKLAETHNAALAVRERKAPLPGLVVIEPNSPQAPAGVALALGRGQPIHLLPSPAETGKPTTPEVLGPFNAAIMQQAIRWQMIGMDQWVGLTLAGNYPYTYKADKAKGDTLAVDDLLGRESRGLRLGVVGRLAPDKVQSVYMAMCSLFLQPKRVLLFDDYANRGGKTFEAYRLSTAKDVFDARYDVELVTGKQTSPTMLRKMTRTGKPFDMIWMNASGQNYSLDIQGRGVPDDMPIDMATCYYVVHSFSAQKPWDGHTVAGRALAGGGYWYFGSAHEPYLSAFVLPTGLAHKAMAGTPLAFAARQMPGHPLYRPWKLVVLGDPLYSLRDTPAARVEPIDLPNTRPADPAAAKDAAGQLALAVITEPSNALAAAARCLKQADTIAPDALARAAQVVYDKGGYRALAALDPAAARRHPISHALVWRALVGEFEGRVRQKDLPTARTYLANLLAVGGDYDAMKTKVKRYLAATGDIGEGPRTQAERWLRGLTQGELPGPSKRAIRDVLAEKK